MYANPKQGGQMQRLMTHYVVPSQLKRGYTLQIDQVFANRTPSMINLNGTKYSQVDEIKTPKEIGNTSCYFRRTRPCPGELTYSVS